MKYNKLITMIVIAWGLATGCNDDVETPSFNVTADQTTVSVGDSVTFSFSGYADIIAFYGGEEGNNYENKDRVSLSGGVPELTFESMGAYGSFNNTLSFWASTDFSGTYDSTSVADATWTELTDFVIPENSDFSNYTSSGTHSLEQFVGNPVVFAFKYQAETGATQRKWQIGSFDINYVQDEGSAAVTDLSGADWTAVDMTGSKSWTVSSTYLLHNSSSSTEASNLDWIITDFLILDQATPDYAVPIKGADELALDDYKYAFSTAGTYNVVFVGTNGYKGDTETVVRTLQITVTE